MTPVVRKAQLVRETALGQQVLRTFLYDIVDAPLEEKISAFPLRFYSENYTFYELRQRFAEYCAENTQEDFSNEEILFLVLTQCAQAGCLHHYSNCRLICAICAEDFSCVRCHERDHAFLFAGIKCAVCGMVQRTLTNQCDSCLVQFGAYFCAECCIFDLFDEYIRPSFHCPQCYKCKVGIKMSHCQTCNACRPVPHVCLNVDEIMCPLCTEALSRGPVVALRCSHFIHKACKDKMFQSSRFVCPQCRRLMLSPRYQRQYNNKMVSLYQNEPISQRLIKRLFWFQCNECSHEFVEINHPIGVRCANHECLSFNTSVLHPCDEKENPEYILYVQCQVLLEHGIPILQNHVNDYKYYSQLFPKLFCSTSSQTIESNDMATSEDNRSAFYQILCAFGIENLEEEEIVDYLEVIEQNYVHGMTLGKAKELLIEYIKQLEQRK